MATNTLGGINLAAIAERSLEPLLLQFQKINSFSTDFSDEVRARGESISTRVASLLTAVNLSTAGYVPQNTTTTVKTVTLNKFYGHVIGLKDEEVAKAGSADWLTQIFVNPMVECLCEQVMDDLLALVTTANFSNVETIGTTSFDADSAADLARNLNTANVPKAGRFALLSPSYLNNLIKDNAIQNSSAYGNNSAIVNGTVGRVHGLDVYDYNDIPTTDNLVGIVGGKQGLLLAARTVAVPNDFPGEVINKTEPVTGLPIQFRAWYDANSGEHRVAVGLLYGVAVGQDGEVYRIRHS